MASRSDGRVVIDTQLNNKGFTKGIAGLKNEMGGLKAVVGKLGGVIASAFAVKAVVDFGKECVELGSNIAEVQNVVDTAFGDMSHKVEAFADTAIQNFGMSRLAAKKTASTYMAMAKAMGLTDEAASEMAISLTGMTGDVASFYNITQELADTKLKSVFTGETETLKELGVVMTVANLEAYALKKGITKSYEAMSQAEKVALRYNYVMDTLSMAQGDFVKTSNSWANQTRILSMQWEEFMSIVGQLLITVLTPTVKVINQIVSELIAGANAANAFVASIYGTQAIQVSNTSAVTSGINGSVDAQNDLTAATEETSKAQKKLLAGFDEINKLDNGADTTGAIDIAIPTTTETTEVKVEPIVSDSSLAKFFEDFKAAFAPAKDAMGGLTGSIKQFSGVAKECLLWVWENILVPFGQWTISEELPAGIDLLTEAFNFLSAACTFLQPAWKWIWDNLLLPIAGWSGDIVVGGLRELADLLRDITGVLNGDISFAEFITNLTAVQTAILGIATALAAVSAANAVGKGLNAITACISGIQNGTGIIGKMAEVIKLTAGGAGTLGEAIKAVFGPGSTIAGIAAIIGGAVLAFTNFFSMLKDGFSWVKEALMVLGIAIAAVGAIILGAPALITAVIAAIVAAVATLVVLVKEHWEEIKVAAGKCWEWIKETWSKIAGWFKKNVTEPISNFFRSFINGLISGVESFVNFFIRGLNKVIGAANKLSFDIPDWVPGIGGKTFGFNIPAVKEIKLPRLANGSVVPPNREFLAVLGDNKTETEVVSPLSTMKQAMLEALRESGSTSSGTITVVVNLDGKEVARNQVKHINDMTRQAGKPVLLF